MQDHVSTGESAFRSEHISAGIVMRSNGESGWVSGLLNSLRLYNWSEIEKIDKQIARIKRDRGLAQFLQSVIMDR